MKSLSEGASSKDMESPKKLGVLLMDKILSPQLAIFAHNCQISGVTGHYERLAHQRASFSRELNVSVWELLYLNTCTKKYSITCQISLTCGFKIILIYHYQMPYICLQKYLQNTEHCQGCKTDCKGKMLPGLSLMESIYTSMRNMS